MTNMFTDPYTKHETSSHGMCMGNNLKLDEAWVWWCQSNARGRKRRGVSDVLLESKLNLEFDLKKYV